MALADKYISTTASLSKPDPTRIKLSDDIYAQCETMEQLMKELKFAIGRRNG